MVAKTILIADGGSTKTDWSIVSGNREIDRIRTGGINPFFQTEEEISAEIRDNLIPRIRESDSVGCHCRAPFLCVPHTIPDDAFSSENLELTAADQYQPFAELQAY